MKKNSSLLFLILVAIKALEGSAILESSSSQEASGSLFENSAEASESAVAADSGIKSLVSLDSPSVANRVTDTKKKEAELPDNNPFNDESQKAIYKSMAPQVRPFNQEPERKSILKSEGAARSTMGTRKSVSINVEKKDEEGSAGMSDKHGMSQMSSMPRMSSMSNTQSMSDMPGMFSMPGLPDKQMPRMSSMPMSRMSSSSMSQMSHMQPSPSPSSRMSSMPRMSQMPQSRCTLTPKSPSHRQSKPASYYEEVAAVTTSSASLEGIKLGFCDTAVIGAVTSLRMLGLKYPRQANSAERYKLAQYVNSIVESFPCEQEKKLMQQVMTEMPPIYSDRARFNKWAIMFGKRVLKETKCPVGVNMNNLLIAKK